MIAVLPAVTKARGQVYGSAWRHVGLPNAPEVHRRPRFLNQMQLERALHELADFASGMTDRYAVRIASMLSGI